MATTDRKSAVAKGFANIPVTEFVVEQLSSDPSGGGLVEGRLWENTTTHLLKGYLNGTVVTIAPLGAGLTQEQVEDFVGALIVDSATIDWTYNDAGGSLSGAVLDSPTLEGSNKAYYRSTDNHVDGTTNHVFTAADDTKLTGVATGATANDTDANLKARGNHTGTQTASTISDFSAAADARITNWVGAAPGALDTLVEIAAELTADESTAAALATTVATKVTKLTAATITAGGTSTTITSTSRDCGCTVRFNDGDYEDVDAIVERPTATSMVVRITAQSRDVRVIPWQA